MFSSHHSEPAGLSLRHGGPGMGGVPQERGEFSCFIQHPHSICRPSYVNAGRRVAFVR